MSHELDEIRAQTVAAVAELVATARLTRGDLVVVGCSSSAIAGEWLGTSSSPEIGATVAAAVLEVLGEHGLHLAAQCCEHLNRALVVERAVASERGYERVNAVPQPKAGGSFATAVYAAFAEPVVVEFARAEAGLDIGGTLIGMHLRHVAVPLRLAANAVGEAHVTAARTRAKFVGGGRAVYDETLL